MFAVTSTNLLRGVLNHVDDQARPAVSRLPVIRADPPDEGQRAKNSD
jgi:hypothetical protein